MIYKDETINNALYWQSYKHIHKANITAQAIGNKNKIKNQKTEIKTTLQMIKIKFPKLWWTTKQATDDEQVNNEITSLTPWFPTCVSEAVELMPSKSRSLSAFCSPLTWWPLDKEPLSTVPFSVGPGPQRGCQIAVPSYMNERDGEKW